MNIVKGVADLLRRSSGQGGGSTSPEQAEVLNFPGPRIQFRELGDEAILKAHWDQYKNAVDKDEKWRLLQVFLLHFLLVYKNWTPACPQMSEMASSAIHLLDYTSEADRIFVGCTLGHPAEVVLAVTQEITSISNIISSMQFSSDILEPPISLNGAEYLNVVNALSLLSRSMVNSRTFISCGGVRKLMALIKAAVIQLKSVPSMLSAHEQLSSPNVERISFLLKLLFFSVSVISNVISLECKTVDLYSNFLDDCTFKVNIDNSSKIETDPTQELGERKLYWQQKAVTAVMEAGGLNWLVELLRAVRRLTVKDQFSGGYLQALTLVTLKSAVSENSRAQNHFRSIGGLDVLMDELGLPSSDSLYPKDVDYANEERHGNPIFGGFYLQILSLEVLREGIFGNLNNMQFLCENGRVHKLANNICWPAFMLQELFQEKVVSHHMADLNCTSSLSFVNHRRQKTNLLPSSTFNLWVSENWHNYSLQLSKALCSFLLAPEDFRFENHETSTHVRVCTQVSLSFWELGLRWIGKVLHVVFPCLKACSNLDELPSHIRTLTNALQKYILYTFRKLLGSSPVLLETFRAEGLWNLIFSENFFYHELASRERHIPCSEQTVKNHTDDPAFGCSRKLAEAHELDRIQMEILSLIEFAATLNVNSHNLSECSVLMDALDKSARYVGESVALVKGLHQILKLSVEQTVSSLVMLDAVARLPTVACIQMQEVRRVKKSMVESSEVSTPVSSQHISDSAGSAMIWSLSVEATLDLFMDFLALSDDGMRLALCNSKCIDGLFDLFWEGNLRDRILSHILSLLKLKACSNEDETAKLRLCSKYLETFTLAREREEAQFVELSTDLLSGIRETLKIDLLYYQSLFRNGGCFLHIVSLLNGNLEETKGEQLVLNVFMTLTCLLTGNDASKDAFRALVGAGYQTLQRLLLDFCWWQPSLGLFSALLDMLVDGKYDAEPNILIKNEDTIMLILTLLQKSSEELRSYGLDVFQLLVKDSFTNQASCFRAGMLSFLLDWFSVGDNDTMIPKIADLIQSIGGYSISGKDIRKIFAILRGDKNGCGQRHLFLLLRSVKGMLKEKGPTAFFELSESDSGIEVATPMRWPCSKGFSISCWARVERYPETGAMTVFAFLSDNGRGCAATLDKEKLIYESIGQKMQSVVVSLNLAPKKWYFLCITHSIGRAFSGGSMFRCYLDGDLVSCQKCSYAKVMEVLTQCRVGKRTLIISNEDNNLSTKLDSLPLHGQLGPVYFFGDALSPEQVRGMYALGPSYMYSFIGDEPPSTGGSLLFQGVQDTRDSLSSKLIFGFNAQANDGTTLFNIAEAPDYSSDKSLYTACVSTSSQLCSRRSLQHIIYCVGGISVFFPLLTQFGKPALGEMGCEMTKDSMIRSIMKDKLAAEVVELIASVLDENLANQQQMHLLSGFSILGFLLQSISPEELTLELVSALKHLLGVIFNSGMSDTLVKEAIPWIYLNPRIWAHSEYIVQREIFMFLVQHFERDTASLTYFCRLPKIILLVHQFYWDTPKDHSAFGSKPLLHPVTREIIWKRPNSEEIRKIRLLLLSLAEMSLRKRVATADVKALAAFFERSDDMVCVEDVLHMIIRVVYDKTLMASFLEQVDLLGGCQVFINLLQRDEEPIRLLALQFMGKLLTGFPSEKKGGRLLSLAVGRVKSLSDGQRGLSTKSPCIFTSMMVRLFKYPLTDSLCATLFDLLLGGASPKQVLQKHNEKSNLSGYASHFVLPQILLLIFKFLSKCHDRPMRLRILSDLLNLLDSSPMNYEAFVEIGWQSWLSTSIELDAIKMYKPSPYDNSSGVEETLVRKLYSAVLSYFMYSVKGGWQQLEEMTNFIFIQVKQGGIPFLFFRDILEDVMDKLINLSCEENTFFVQPCRDNSLYLIRLLDEMLVRESDLNLPFPGMNFSKEFVPEALEQENPRDFSSAVFEALQAEASYPFLSSFSSKEVPAFGRLMNSKQLRTSNNNDVMEDYWWNIYDKLWILLSEMNGKGPSRNISRPSLVGGPSFGQRARGLVESLNIPAAEMAAVVVSGGLSNALGGKANKYVDKAMLLRGEKCPRIVFRLVILYLCKADIDRASRCVQQFVALLPCFFTLDDEPSRSRLQLFIWSLHVLRSQFGMLDDGAKFHLASHLIRESINYGKFVLASGVSGTEGSFDLNFGHRESSSIFNLLQKDRVILAVSEEAKYLSQLSTDRAKQVEELHTRMEDQNSWESVQKNTFEDELQSNLNMILSADENMRISNQVSSDEDQQIVAEKWIHMFRALTDERGPWSSSPFPNGITKHWKLDKTEDALRRRPKLRRNYHFDDRLCHPPTSSSIDLHRRDVSPLPNFEGQVPQGIKHFVKKDMCQITEDGLVDICENEHKDLCEVKCSNDILTSDNLNSETGNCKDDSGQNDMTLNWKNVEPDVADAEEDVILLSVPCLLVTPKRKVAGRLEVMQFLLHFHGEYLVEGTGGLSVFKVLNNSGNIGAKTDQAGRINKQKLQSEFVNKDDDFEKNNSGVSKNAGTVSKPFLQNLPKNIKRHRRWNLCKINGVHWTRYLLHHTAIEIFFSNSIAPVFLNFPSQKVAKDVGTLIASSRNDALYPKGSARDKNDIIYFVDRRVALEKAERARESWRRREISNFEYLMMLNTLSGRSYNDLTQYPIFPWVLTDYSSEKLDLNKSSTFRDLSKPVGALNLKRFEVFEERFRNFCDPDIPSFYYGSHYSSMGIVLFYLLRLEPFTMLHRNLQGGKFDHADRLFQSIEGTYNNCLSNTSDVKELIPEFFYLPEFLVNSNGYHLGVKQDGEPLVDVILPPWCKGSPQEFIYKNREALESEYVSSNLHHWIDLIFGYKQRGKPAVEALNIFYYLTYEGSVDLDTLDDELQRSAIEDQIANFGQTPIQIFRKKHPRRGPPVPIARPLYYAPASITLTSTFSPTSQNSSAVLFMSVLDSSIIIVNQGLTMSVKMWLTTQLQSGGNYTFSGSQEPFFGIGSDILTARRIGSPFSGNIELGSQCLASLQTSAENCIITCGNWGNSFQIVSLGTGRVVQSINQHKDIVSCIAVASDGSVVATGSYDTTVMVWDVHIKAWRTRYGHVEVARKDHVISDTPFHILCGHDDIITCLFVSVELDIVISGSKDGTCIFHTLREGRYIRSIQNPSKSAISKLVVSQHGKLVFYASDDLCLHMYSINGKHIASSESTGRLHCVELSRCGDYLVCAGDQGHIILRSMHSLNVIMRYEGVGKAITSLTVTPEECFLAGTKDGNVLVYSIETPQLRRNNVSRIAKPQRSNNG